MSKYIYQIDMNIWIVWYSFHFLCVYIYIFRYAQCITNELYTSQCYICTIRWCVCMASLSTVTFTWLYVPWHSEPIWKYICFTSPSFHGTCLWNSNGSFPEVIFPDKMRQGEMSLCKLQHIHDSFHQIKNYVHIYIYNLSICKLLLIRLNSGAAPVDW